MKSLRIALYCALGGLGLAPVALGNHQFGWTWLAGIAMAAAFVPVALYGPRGIPGQFLVIVPVFLVVTDLCLWSEVMIFFPGPETQQHAMSYLIAPAVTYIIVAVVLAVLATILRMAQADGPEIKMRPPMQVAALVLVCGLAYAVYYLIFGDITYRFFTHSYYPDGPQIVARLGVGRFWLIQIARGVLMTLAVLPVVYTLRARVWPAALAVGWLLWVTGGAGPLLLPNAILVPTARFIHTIEILFENAAFGVTVVLLMRARALVKE